MKLKQTNKPIFFYLGEGYVSYETSFIKLL